MPGNPMINKILEKHKSRGMVAVVSAPSGTGKTTLCRMIVDDIQRAVFSVSITSRPPRPGEKPGYDYVFVDKEDFKQRAQSGEMLEWAKVHGHYYGTSKELVRSALEQDKYVILDIDVQGGIQIKKIFPAAVLVFVMPPSMEELKRRIENRKSETAEEIEKRLQNARDEMEKAPEYDYLVINSDIDKAVSEIKSIIISESLRI